MPSTQPLSDPLWQARRSAEMRRAQHSCELCKSTVDLQVVGASLSALPSPWLAPEGSLHVYCATCRGERNETLAPHASHPPVVRLLLEAVPFGLGLVGLLVSLPASSPALPHSGDSGLIEVAARGFVRAVIVLLCSGSAVAYTLLRLRQRNSFTHLDTASLLFNGLAVLVSLFLLVQA